MGHGVHPSSTLCEPLATQPEGTTEQAISGTAVTGATLATPIVITATSHGVLSGDHVWIFGVEGNEAANGLFIAANPDANTFELTDLAGAPVEGTGAWTSGGMVYLAFVFAPTMKAFLHRLNLQAVDLKYQGDKYMSLAALTNGILVQIRDPIGLIKDLLALPVKRFVDWGLASGVDAGGISPGADAAGLVRWTFSKYSENREPIIVDGTRNEVLVMLVQDDLSSLGGQQAAVEGYWGPN